MAKALKGAAPVAAKGAVGHQAIGKAVIVYGEVKVIAADGTVRILKPNSLVFADDQIITGSDGTVSILLDGNPPMHIDLGRMSQITLDEDVYGSGHPTTTADAAADAARIQQLLTQGDQPIQSESPAAGGEASAGGGHPIVNLALTGNIIDPESGAETRGIDYSTIDTLQGGGIEEDTAPIGGLADGAVDEDGLPRIGNHDEINDSDHPAEESYVVGNLGYSFGDDGPAATNPFVWTTDGLAAMGIESNGHELLYEVVDGGLTLNAYYMGSDYPKGDGPTLFDYQEGPDQMKVYVFSVQVTDVNTGAYNFELYKPLDHPVADTEDDINYHFTYTLTDGDGSTGTGSLDMLIDDDMPVVSADATGLPELVLDESPIDNTVLSPQDTNNIDFASAINLDGHFAVGSDPEVGNAATVPYVSIHGVGNNAVDVFSFTVTQAGTLAVFDIDHGGFDTTLRVYNSSGTEIFYQDDGYADDPGSSSDLDSYQSWTFSDPGTYYVVVGRWSYVNIPTGASYELQISLPNAITGGAGEGDGIWTMSADFSGHFDVAYGADGPGDVAYALSLNGDDMGSGLYTLGEDGAQGSEIMLQLDGDDIVGVYDGTEYFRIAVNEDTGIVNFTRFENIWHPEAGESAAAHDDAAWLNAATNTIVLTATAVDYDGDTNSASLDLSTGVFGIEDDGPTVFPEDAQMPTLTLDESPISIDGIRSVTQDFSGNFGGGYGTDGPGTTAYALVLTGTAVGSGLFAVDPAEADGKGEEILLYQGDDGVVEGRVGDQVYFTISADNDPESPTFGSVTFTQTVEEGVSVWHANTGNPDDTSTLDVDEGDGQIPNSLELVKTITDADGDTAQAALDLGDGVFKIEDDGPRFNAALQATVEEDGMSMNSIDDPGHGDTGDLSEGNKDGLDTYTDDEASGAAGSLNALVDFGSDGPGKFALLDDVDGLPTLYSKGEPVTYDVTDEDGDGSYDTLTATADGRTVFTLTVNTDGSWTFDLDDQLDHLDDNTNSENWDLFTGYDQSQQATSVPSIDFTSILKVTDADGDQLNWGNGNAFTIKVQDDIPVQAPGKDGAPYATIHAQVLEDGLAYKEGDLSEGNKESGETNADDETSNTASGSLTNLVLVGADEEATFSLLKTVDLDGKLPTLYSKGEPVTYDVTDEDGDGSYDTLTATADGRTVFTLTVDSDGNWSFDLKDQLDHVDNGNNDENWALYTGQGEDPVSAIDFTQILVATDADGDELSWGADDIFTVAVQDDVPYGPELTWTEGRVVLDESLDADYYGNDANAADDDDVSGNPFDLTWGTPIGLMSKDLIDVAGGVEIGADETPGEGIHATMALALPDGEGMDSGLATTDGTPIYLFTEDDGTVTGRVGSYDDVEDEWTPDEAGDVAFAIAINNDGEVTVAQYASLYHPDDTNPDDYVDLDGKLDAVVTVTDYDGDEAASTQPIGAWIRFEDDGPTIYQEDMQVPTLTVDESPLPTTGDGVRSDTADFSGNFFVDYGTDEKGSAAYDLVLTGTAVGSGLFAVNPAEADGKGAEILLYQDGNDVVGKVGTQEYFRITVDNVATSPTFGSVTFTQTVATGVSIWHEDTGNPDDVSTLFVDPGEGEGDGYIPNSLKLVQTITDGDGDSAQAGIDLSGAFQIEDDGPHAVNDYDGVVVDEEGVGSTSGFVLPNDSFGSDGPVPGVVTSVSYDGTDYTISGPTTIQGEFGDLLINPDGSYTYTYDREPELIPVSITPIDYSGATIYAYDNLSPFENDGSLNLVFNPDGTLAIHGGQGADKQGFGVDGDKGAGTVDYGEHLIFKLAEPIIGTFSFELGELNKGQVKDLADITWKVFDEDGDLIQAGNLKTLGGTLNPDGTYTANDITFTHAVSYVVFGYEQSNGQGYTVTDLHYEYQDYPTGLEDFQYTITDGDGDTSMAHLYITSDMFIEGDGSGNVLTGGAGDDILQGYGGNDTLIGGAGNDILVGGAGADTFAFSDTGATNVDHIIDYSATEGDRIDLSALLDGITTTNIGDFVKFETVDDDVKISVDKDGTGSTYTPKEVAVLDNYATPDVDHITVLIDGTDYDKTA
jgi:T1SS-143 domain-containing protein